MAFAVEGAPTPNTVSSSVARTRKYLTGKGVEKSMEAARKSSRYGHRDATMIFGGYFNECQLVSRKKFGLVSGSVKIPSAAHFLRLNQNGINRIDFPID
jgi:hypothetical protein